MAEAIGHRTGALPLSLGEYCSYERSGSGSAAFAAAGLETALDESCQR